MTIWKRSISVTAMNERSRNTLMEQLGIQFTEFGDDYVMGTMPVDVRTHQPLGIMHGGASCVLAETLGSTAANFCVDIEQFYCVGLSISTNHIRSIRTGLVIGKATPEHLGRSTQLWNIDIHNEAGQLISVTRLTMAVLARVG
jgi:uncharacterized protein (TIGR00369 family)